MFNILIFLRLKPFFFKQKTAYEIGVRLVGSEMCIRDRIIVGVLGMIQNEKNTENSK